MNRSPGWAPLRSPLDCSPLGDTSPTEIDADHAEHAGDATNVWLKPLDVREEAERKWWKQVCDVFVVASGLVLLVCGVSLLLFADFEENSDTFKVPLPNTRLKPAEGSALPSYTWPYILSTLTLELLCLTATGLGLCCVAMTLGRHSLVHSLSVFSLMNDTCLVAVYTASAIWGNLVLWKLVTQIDWSQDNAPHWTLSQSALFFYVLTTTLLATGYALSRMSTFIGICGFGIHQLRRKMQGGPVVEFYKQYNAGDEFYVRVVPADDYAEYIAHMPNPLLPQV